MRRKITVVVTAAALMALAACDTQPATDVTDSAATLNGKGACAAGASGHYQYQLRQVTNTGGGVSAFADAGPRFTFACSGSSGEVALGSHREQYLRPSTGYEFRLVSRLDNGTVQTWDSNGTNGGSAYDSFTTGPVTEQEEPVEVRDVTAEDLAGDPSAAAAGCRSKEINNRRAISSWPLKRVLVNYNLRTRWRYCKGQVTRMYAASTDCAPTSEGAFGGYRCDHVTKVRAYSLGGNPEHVVWTYSWLILGKVPTKDVYFFSKTVCASNYGSGSGAHYRNGRCDLVPWGT